MPLAVGESPSTSLLRGDRCQSKLVKGQGPAAPPQNQHCVLRTQRLPGKETSGQPSLRKETQPLLALRAPVSLKRQSLPFGNPQPEREERTHI